MANENNGLELQHGNTKIKAFGEKALFLIAAAGIAGIIHLSSEQLKTAIVESHKSAIAAINENTKIQIQVRAAVEHAAVISSKEHKASIYNYQVDMCIRHIERTKDNKLQEWLWARWDNKAQVKVYCPWLGEGL